MDSAIPPGWWLATTDPDQHRAIIEQAQPLFYETAWGHLERGATVDQVRAMMTGPAGQAVVQEIATSEEQPIVTVVIGQVTEEAIREWELINGSR